MKKALIYCRVSTEEQAEKGIAKSLEAYSALQRKNLESILTAQPEKKEEKEEEMQMAA